MNSLVELNLNYNKLQSLPISFSNLQNLKYLNLRYNPFNDEDEDLSNKTINSLFQYLINKRKEILKNDFILKSKKRWKELVKIENGLIIDLR